MMKKWKQIFFSVLSFGVFLTAPQALATTTVDGNFELISDEPLFSVMNAVPGGEYTSDFIVENIGTDTENLQMKVNVKTDPKILADVLFLKIKNKDTNVCLLGCDSPLKIQDANDTELLFNNIGAKEIKNYTFVLLFDTAAGNTFQDKQLIFDMTLGYQSSVPGTTATSLVTSHKSGRNGNGNGGGGNGGTVRLSGVTATGGAGGGAKTIPQVGGAETPGTVAGVEEKIPNEGTVQGAETRCISLSLWVWIALVLVFTAGFTIKKISSSVAILRNGVIVQIVFLIGALAVWYLFDSCRAFIWVPVAILIVAGVSMLIPNARHR